MACGGGERRSERRRGALLALLAAAPFLRAPSADAVACLPPCVASGADEMVLALYFHAGRADHLSAASGESRAAAADAGYAYVRDEARVFRDFRPGLIPLRLFWHAGRQDFATVGSPAAQTQMYNVYSFVRLEGWVYPTPQPGTVPLYLYWSAARNESFLAATAQAMADAAAGGYAPMGIEGYAFPAAP